MLRPTTKFHFQISSYTCMCAIIHLKATPRDWKSQRQTQMTMKWYVCSWHHIILQVYKGLVAIWIKLSWHTCGLMCVCVCACFIIVYWMCLVGSLYIMLTKIVQISRYYYNLKMRQNIVHLWCHYSVADSTLTKIRGHIELTVASYTGH